MSNRHCEELSCVYKALFEDAAYSFPELRDEFTKDIVRLRECVLRRGIGVFLTDLPALCKHLDRCLDEGQYKVSGLPLSKRYSGTVVIPKFLRGLYLLVFDAKGHLKEDYNVEAIFFLRQILSAAKKIALPCSAEAVVNEVNDFFSVDERLPEPERFWSDPSPTRASAGETYRGFGTSTVVAARAREIFGPERTRDLVGLVSALDQISGMMTSVLGAYNPDEWNFKHGPGAVSDVVGPTNKYCWTNWSERLEHVFPLADYGFHSYTAWAGGVADRVIGTEEPSSRLISVPKTFTKPRLIAAEPREHQWCQQNIWHYFCSRVESTWLGNFIRFTDQSLNQRLCQEGSVTGSLTTVDLSAASDRVTPHVVGQLFRGNPGLLLALQSTRTRFITQEVVKERPRVYELRKFSTMGSACTFPVESLIFLNVALAACLYTRKLPVTVESIKSLTGSVAVFGDDIIVPTDCRESLVLLLELLWFKVNLSKSFWNGLFRESCGVDSFGGVDVTPAYWKGRIGNDPESTASTIASANNFYKKFMVRTSCAIATTIRRINIPFVRVGSGIIGLESFVVPPNRSKTRWNKDLQRHESLVPVFLTRVQKTPTNDDSALLQFFTEEPSPLVSWTHGYTQRPELKLRNRWIATANL